MHSFAHTTTTSSTSAGRSVSGVIVAIGAATGPLRQDAPLDLWATPGWDAYAYEAVYNPARISLAAAEADIRQQLAEFGAQVAEFLNEDEPAEDPEAAARIEGHVDRIMTALREHPGPLTAAGRGAQWMLRWDCPSDCTANHGSPAAPDWHTSHRIETGMRDIDAGLTPEENAAVPWLGAQVVVINDKPQAYGRKTRVWVDYGHATGELSPAEARQALTELRAFADRLEAVVEAAERSAAADFSGDPEIARLDREATDHRVRAITEGGR